MLNGFPINNRYLLFPKGAIDEEHIFLISGSFTGDWPTQDEKTPSETDGYLVFLSYSNGYGNYLDVALKLTELKKSSDMSTIYLRDNVYSNITGGLGIFGGVCVQHQIWNKTYTDMMAWEEFWKKCDEGYYDDWGAWMYGPYISENSGVEELVEQGLLTLKQF